MCGATSENAKTRTVYGLSYQSADLHLRLERRGMVHALRRLLKIGFGCVVNVDELLRVAVHEWKPRALNLHHDAMALQEVVIYVRHFVTDLRRLIRLHWFWC